MNGGHRCSEAAYPRGMDEGMAVQSEAAPDDCSIPRNRGEEIGSPQAVGST